MKKLVMLSLVVLTLQSCSLVKKIDNTCYRIYWTCKFNYWDWDWKRHHGEIKEYHCEESIKNAMIYEDTIEKIFLCVDSSIFKNKNLNIVDDSLSRIANDDIYSADLLNNNTGYIFRVWYNIKNCDFEDIYLKEEYTWIVY